MIQEYYRKLSCILQRNVRLQQSDCFCPGSLLVFSLGVSPIADIDPEVLGGAIIYAGDQVIDGSLLGRLNRLEASLPAPDEASSR